MSPKVCVYNLQCLFCFLVCSMRMRLLSHFVIDSDVNLSGCIILNSQSVRSLCVRGYVCVSECVCVCVWVTYKLRDDKNAHARKGPVARRTQSGRKQQNHHPNKTHTHTHTSNPIEQQSNNNKEHKHI